MSTQGVTYPSVLGVYQGDTIAELDLVAEEGFNGSSGDWRSVRFEATAGDRYQIAVASAGGLGPDTGMAVLNIKQTPSEELRFTAITTNGDRSITLLIEGFTTQAFTIENSSDLVVWSELDSYTSADLPLVLTLPSPPPNTNQFFRTKPNTE